MVLIPTGIGIIPTFAILKKFTSRQHLMFGERRYCIITFRGVHVLPAHAAKAVFQGNRGRYTIRVRYSRGAHVLTSWKDITWSFLESGGM
jgi:hypothetical protein